MEALEVTRAILDTSVVIASGEDEALLSALPDESAISVATLAELHFGVTLAKTQAVRAQRVRRLGAIESTFSSLPIDAEIARAYATVAHAVMRSGRKPRARVMDLWIAATALVHAVPILTRNPSDFRSLESLVEVRQA
jgi:predicted nucleic acid-binding protein